MLEFNNLTLQDKLKELTIQQRIYNHRQALTGTVKAVCGVREDLVKDVVWVLIALRNECVGYDADEFTTAYPRNKDIFHYAKKAIDVINPANLQAELQEPMLIDYVRSQLDNILDSTIFDGATSENFVRTIKFNK